jgi:signal transduction histidine kinase/ActR/RegA family two-component response regulator
VTGSLQDVLARRVLLLTPTGKDARLACEMLGNAGFDCLACRNGEAFEHELKRGAGTVLIAEEALANGAGNCLTAAVARQPPWSDLPVLILTRRGADSSVVARAVEKLGNVTLLERPIRVSALVSAVRTALRARERQYLIKAYLAEREEADRRKDEFLATLAHELRNPLAPIRTSVQILRLSGGKHGVNPDQLCEMMDRQVNHMVRLVDDLLEVSRITRGKIELRKSRCTLTEIIASAVEISRPLADAGQHRLSVTLPETPLYLEADPTRLAQVFANLLNNAAKYTPRGGHIQVIANCDETTVRVSVQDDGAGIDSRTLPHVFEMFVQGAQVPGSERSGLGIGLTLVRTLVQMHGGSVAAHSEGPGRGSRFTVALPRAAAPATESAAEPSFQTAIPALLPVLVVDDNEDAAASLGVLLQMLGADVQVVHDGPAALDAVAGRPPMAVFLDLGMPNMNGFEVARRLRCKPEARDTVLIALTGWGQESDRRNAKEAGFDHHLIKPASVEALKALLQSVSKYFARSAVT